MNKLKTHLSSEELAIAAEQIIRHKNLPVAVRSHLDKCDSCKYELMTLIELLDENPGQNNMNFRQRSGTWLAVAAAVIVLLTVGVWWTLNNNPKQNLQPEQITQQLDMKDSTINIADLEEEFSKEEKKQPTLINDNQLALATFRPNPELERLSQRYQTEMRNAINALVQVKTNMDSIHFSWDVDGNLFFELYNNEGVLLEEIETSSRAASFKVKQAGLYYFKLINQDFDLLWCGRIESESN